jgi:hypothetical protein
MFLIKDTTESQHIKSDTGKELTLNIVHKQSEEDIDVIDDNGEPVIKVEIMEEHVRSFSHSLIQIYSENSY